MVLLALVAVVLASCNTGNNNSSGSGTSAPTTSGLNNRVLVSNACVPSTLGCATLGALDMIDANSDILTIHTFTVGPRPGLMAVSGMVSGHRLTTLVFNAGNNTISVVNNSLETVVGTIALRGATASMAVSPDGLTGYAAVPGAVPAGQTAAGLVAVMNLSLTSPAVTAELPVPQARSLTLSPDGTKLLVVSDQAVTVINTADDTTAGSFSTGLDHPVATYVTSNNKTAYILNCGPECGGTTASVTVLDLTASPLALGANVAVPAAHVGLVDSSNHLYVAGNQVDPVTKATTPVLDVLDISGAAPVVTVGPVPIGDGVHTSMALGNNNKLFIGAQNSASSNCVFTGCLTFFDVVAHTAAVDDAFDTFRQTYKGEVTGMQSLPFRSEMYVVEGSVSGGTNVSNGELHIYNTTFSPPTEVAGKIDIAGQAVDVKALDQ